MKKNTGIVLTAVICVLLSIASILLFTRELKLSENRLSTETQLTELASSLGVHYQKSGSREDLAKYNRALASEINQKFDDFEAWRGTRIVVNDDETVSYIFTDTKGVKK